jgi:hypothetical protein
MREFYDNKNRLDGCQQTDKLTHFLFDHIFIGEKISVENLGKNDRTSNF